jgi:hypothetical protein
VAQKAIQFWKYQSEMMLQHEITESKRNDSKLAQLEKHAQDQLDDAHSKWNAVKRQLDATKQELEDSKNELQQTQQKLAEIARQKRKLEELYASSKDTHAPHALSHAPHVSHAHLSHASHAPHIPHVVHQSHEPQFFTSSPLHPDIAQSPRASHSPRSPRHERQKKDRTHALRCVFMHVLTSLGFSFLRQGKTDPPSPKPQSMPRSEPIPKPDYRPFITAPPRPSPLTLSPSIARSNFALRPPVTPLFARQSI